MPDDFAIVELPAAFAGKNTLGVLVFRELVSTTFASVHLGTNYALDGNPVDSYQQVGALTQFAFIGSLTADYPATTNVIDNVVKATVQLDGVDTLLPDLTPFDALTNKLILFCGDEMMSVVDATLLAAGKYQLSLVRGIYGSPIEAHVKGDEVYLALKTNIIVVNSDHFLSGNTARFKTVFGDRNISDADPFDYPVVGKALQLGPPTALTINGNSSTPAFDPTIPIQISWQLPDSGTLDQSADTIFTKLEFIRAGVVVHTELIPWTQTDFTILWSAITALSSQTFVLRASTVVRSGWANVEGNTTELTVIKFSSS